MPLLFLIITAISFEIIVKGTLGPTHTPHTPHSNKMLPIKIFFSPFKFFKILSYDSYWFGLTVNLKITLSFSSGNNSCWSAETSYYHSIF